MLKSGLMASTPKSSPQAEIYKFGAFEVNAQKGKLLKRGIRVALEPRGLEVLLILLRSHGTTVSRTDIIQKIWHRANAPEDFYDHLAQAIAKVRRALSDSATNPRYIETEPGTGYVFIAPVELVAISGSSSAKPKLIPFAVDIDEISEPPSVVERPDNGVVKSAASSINASSPDEKRMEVPRLSSQDGFYGGEGGICAAVSISYGIMVGLALPAEVAYRWPDFSRWAFPASLCAGVASAFLTAISLLLMRRAPVTAKHFDARALAVAGVLCLWTLLLALAAAPWLPDQSIVQANWQTLTAKVGVAKSLLEALGLPVLSLVPLRAVFVLRQLVGSGDLAPVREAIAHRSNLAMIRGAFVPAPMFSMVAYTVVTLWWLNANAHLLENLKPAPYWGLFVTIASVRAAAGLITLLAVLLWYLLRWTQLTSSI